MKLKQEHFETIRAGITQVMAQYPNIVLRYETGDFPNAERVKDINKRFRWDLFHATGLNKFVCDELYQYLNDAHIDTALKKIVPTIERRY